MKRTHGGCVAARGPSLRRRAGLLSATVLVATLSLPLGVSGRSVEHGDAPDASLQIVSADVVVYGGTPGGVVAAVAAARAGARVVLVEPRTHVGGMIANGLGWTDRGDVGVIGGIAAEFFERARQIEGKPDDQWTVLPSTASALFTKMLSEAGVIVRLGERLVRPGGVTISASRIVEIRTTPGDAFRGDVFIDATYEGDLVAEAGVSYRVGREGRTEYGEPRAGVRSSSAVMRVSGEMDPGFPTAAPGPVGSADNRIQASNYRACLSSDTSNQVPYPRPGGYDADRYQIVLEYIAQKVASGQTPTRTWFLTVGTLGDGKWDLNQTGSLSFGLPGANTDYPTGSYARRAEIEVLHREYQKGFLYFLRNDPRVPLEIRSWMARFGLCADEFTDNGNWPRMLYLREGRRMVGRYVGTQHDVEALISKPDTIGLASYRLDAHHVSRWISGDGQLRVEGSLGATTYQRWSIPYRSLTPQQHEATNLLVPVAASVSHVAHASLRMEPQYMIMGHAAGTAAALAAVRGIAVQSVPIAELQARLQADGAVLDDPGDIANSFYDAVAWAYHEGITSGCSKGHFCPNSPLRRDQMAALLARALDLPPATEDYFFDDAGNTHEDDINRLASAGISFGCSSQRYCPLAVVSREQMAGFLARAFALEPTDVDFFTDDDASTHHVSINRLAASGITSGCTATLFCPKAIVTRGQTMAFLYRHYDGGPSGGWIPEEPTLTGGSPEPSPAGAPTPTADPSPTPQPTGPATPTPSPTPGAEPTPVPTPGGSATPSPSPSPSPEPSASPPTPSPSP